jgi:hypothetical protein
MYNPYGTFAVDIHGRATDEQQYTLTPITRLCSLYWLMWIIHRCNGRSEGVNKPSVTREYLAADAEARHQAHGFEKSVTFDHSFSS